MPPVQSFSDPMQEMNRQRILILTWWFSAERPFIPLIYLRLEKNSAK